MLWTRQHTRSIRLDSGEITFTIRIEEKTRTWTADCVQLKLIAESLQEQHGLKSVNGVFQPTPEFLEALSREYGLAGCQGCTPTVARQIWIATADRFAKLESEFRRSLAKALR